jgi:ABC-2 type transport system permease protein
VTTLEIDSAALGKPIRGPSALGGDWRRFFSLTWTLATLEFKLKFFGSALGYLWQLVRPLMLFGVLYVVFTEFVKIGGNAPHYEVVLLAGIMIYTFFAESTGMAVTSVVDNENLVRKVQFPRLVIPLSVVLTGYFNFVLNFVAVFVFALASGVEPRWSWLEMPFLLLFLGFFCFGLSTLLSALYVRYRDVRPIWDVALPVMFYGSPVLYPLEVIPSRQIEMLLMCNPLAVVLQQTRHALIDPTAMSASEAIGGTPRLLIPLGVTVGVFVLGFWVFNREAPRLAEEL